MTTAEMPRHQHEIAGEAGRWPQGTGIYQTNFAGGSAWTGLAGYGSGVLERAIAKAEGQSRPFNIMPPYVAMNFIIKT